MMIISRSIILFHLIAATCLWTVWEYRVTAAAKTPPNVGPDVIVGVLTGVARYPSSGSVGNEVAFSIGTTSCNKGNANLSWIQNSNMHPVISQNLYRVRNGRIEMLGMSWLKHGFTALQQNACGFGCQSSGTGSALGIGCSDPYGASLNGSQSGLGPRSQINATTGVFPWPKANLPQTGTLDGRIRVHNDDLNPALNAGARYFAESMYIAQDDAASGNGLNNASYREMFVQSAGTGNWTIAFGAPPTVREQPAINAWQAVHPDVKLFVVDIPGVGGGRVIVGMRTTPLGGGAGYHTEFAVENFNSDQSVRSLGVKFGSSPVSNPGFNDVDYQFDPQPVAYSGTDWTPIVTGNEIEWSTASFATNPNANAIRWNTLYSFWCDSELPPRSLTLGMFKPGAVQEVNIDLVETLIPTSFVLNPGLAVAGTIADVFVSDDQYFRLTQLNRRAEPNIILELQSTASTDSPTDFAFRLEATMLGNKYGEVFQNIELFNYDTNQYEIVDIRAAEITDQSLEVTPTGDMSRFVQNGTRTIKARIEWKTADIAARTRFSWYIDVDQAIWLIAD